MLTHVLIDSEKEYRDLVIKYAIPYRRTDPKPKKHSFLDIFIHKKYFITGTMCVKLKKCQ